VRDSVVVTDPEGVVTYWNEGATRLFGWAAEEMVGRHYADRFPEPTRTFVADQIRERAAGVEWNGEYEDHRKDGSRVWIDARVSTVTDAEGRAEGRPESGAAGAPRPVPRRPAGDAVHAVRPDERRQPRVERLRAA
jgi:PAS domain S-box-containing protein